MSEFLLVEDRDGVRLLTLNRPAKKNAINNDMWLALGQAFAEADTDDAIGCLVLTGAGGNFSAGVDLGSFGDGDSDAEHPFAGCARAVASFGEPWIGAASGIAA